MLGIVIPAPSDGSMCDAKTLAVGYSWPWWCCWGWSRSICSRASPIFSTTRNADSCSMIRSISGSSWPGRTTNLYRSRTIAAYRLASISIISRQDARPHSQWNGSVPDTACCSPLPRPAHSHHGRFPRYAPLVQRSPSTLSLSGPFFRRRISRRRAFCSSVVPSSRSTFRRATCRRSRPQRRSLATCTTRVRRSIPPPTIGEHAPLLPRTRPKRKGEQDIAASGRLIAHALSTLSWARWVRAAVPRRRGRGTVRAPEPASARAATADSPRFHERVSLPRG